MDVLTTYDPFREAVQLREQLSSHTRRLGFFFGAGTSMAVGLDGIISLSKKVAEMISEELRPHYKNILEELGEAGNVEGILNRVRVYRELLGDDSSRSFNGISGSMAKLLEREICLAIYRLVNIVTAEDLMIIYGSTTDVSCVQVGWHSASEGLPALSTLIN